MKVQPHQTLNYLQNYFDELLESLDANQANNHHLETEEIMVADEYDEPPF